MKVKTRTWSDVVKGLKIKDELETTNLDKSGTNRRQPIQLNNLIQKSQIT